MRLSELLQIRPGITALIGAGGKTTLMCRLAAELSEVGTVIIGTSTKIRRPADLPVLEAPDLPTLQELLREHRIVCVGQSWPEGKLTEPALTFQELASAADYVLIEADGAHMLPAKAHAAYEPVIPPGTDQTICVLGADAFGQPIRRVCHRPELYASLAGVDPDALLTPELAARVLLKEGLGDRLFVNKAETPERLAAAEALAQRLSLPVIAGSLCREEYLCLS